MSKAFHHLCRRTLKKVPGFFIIFEMKIRMPDKYTNKILN